jgi:hypothetical protein
MNSVAASGSAAVKAGTAGNITAATLIRRMPVVAVRAAATGITWAAAYLGPVIVTVRFTPAVRAAPWCFAVVAEAAMAAEEAEVTAVVAAEAEVTVAVAAASIAD